MPPPRARGADRRDCGRAGAVERELETHTGVAEEASVVRFMLSVEEATGRTPGPETTLRGPLAQVAADCKRRVDL